MEVGASQGDGGGCVLGGYTWRWHHLRMMVEAVSLDDAYGGGIISGWWWRTVMKVGSSQGDGGGCVLGGRSRRMMVDQSPHPAPKALAPSWPPLLPPLKAGVTVEPTNRCMGQVAAPPTRGQGRGGEVTPWGAERTGGAS